MKIICKAVCGETAIVKNGTEIQLISEKNNFRTQMCEPNGMDFWVRFFNSYDKALEDFKERVNVRFSVEKFTKELKSGKFIKND